MVFSSILFLFYFLPAILILYYLSPKKSKNAVLFFGSLFFYAWGEPVHVGLLILSTVFNYFFGIQIEKAENDKKKKHEICFDLVRSCSYAWIYVFRRYAVRVVYR